MKLTSGARTAASDSEAVERVVAEPKRPRPAPLLFGPASSKYRAAKGYFIDQLQAALLLEPRETFKSVAFFGPRTREAVVRLQAEMGVSPTGRAGPEEFARLSLPWPDVLDRCIQLTAAEGFEGTSFTEAEGSLSTSTDDGVTWGIIGFTSVHKEVQELLRTFRTTHPHAWKDALAPLTPAQQNGLAAALASADKHALGNWALFVTPNGKKDVRPFAKTFFRTLGSLPAMQALQWSVARNRYGVRAKEVLSRAFSLDGSGVGQLSALAWALAYDIRVFSNGPSGDGAPKPGGGYHPYDGYAVLAGMSWSTEAERLRQIADVTIHRLTLRNGPDAVHVHGAKRRWITNILQDNGPDGDLVAFGLKPSKQRPRKLRR